MKIGGWKLEENWSLYENCEIVWLHEIVYAKNMEDFNEK